MAGMKNIRRILAWIAIILLVGMYVASFITALLSTPGHGELFKVTLGMTVGVPILVWIILYAIDHSHKE